MPIEIRELVIRARVEPDPAPAPVSPGPAALPRTSSPATGVEAVMRILKDMQER